MASDLYKIIQACVTGTLSSLTVEFYASQFTVGVVCVSGGYPGSYKKGIPITGIFSILSWCMLQYIMQLNDFLQLRKVNSKS